MGRTATFLVRTTNTHVQEASWTHARHVFATCVCYRGTEITHHWHRIRNTHAVSIAETPNIGFTILSAAFRTFLDRIASIVPRPCVSHASIRVRRRCTQTADITPSAHLGIVAQMALVTAYVVLAALIARITPADFANSVPAQLAIAPVAAQAVIHAYAVGITALAAITIQI